MLRFIPIPRNVKTKTAGQLIAIALISFGAAATHAQSFRVIGVLDGDTLDVLNTSGPRPAPMRVRIAEVDAPEKQQDFGQRSKEALSALCFGQQAVVAITDKDRYERAIAHVSCQGKDVGQHMVGIGLAWVYARYAKDPALTSLQLMARTQRIGLWSQADPVPPWLWRKGNH